MKDKLIMPKKAIERFLGVKNEKKIFCNTYTGYVFGIFVFFKCQS